MYLLTISISDTTSIANRQIAEIHLANRHKMSKIFLNAFITDFLSCFKLEAAAYTRLSTGSAAAP